MEQKIYIKVSLVTELLEMKNRGWIKSIRNVNNSGSIGNTLEALLCITENNLQLPNAA